VPGVRRRLDYDFKEKTEAAIKSCQAEAEAATNLATSVRSLQRTALRTHNIEWENVLEIQALYYKLDEAHRAQQKELVALANTWFERPADSPTPAQSATAAVVEGDYISRRNQAEQESE
jgi:hypothetical protein